MDTNPTPTPTHPTKNDGTAPVAPQTLAVSVTASWYRGGGGDAIGAPSVRSAPSSVTHTPFNVPVAQQHTSKTMPKQRPKLL